MSKELEESWNNSFQSSPPVAHRLKHNFNERWFRIHTLPDSKRYPENENETKEILRRHNFTLNNLFGMNHKYFLLTGSYYVFSLIDQPKKRNELVKLNLQSNYWQKVNVAEKNEEPCYQSIYFDEKGWVENSVNEVLQLVINDEIRNVMLFSSQKNIVYHPYDGGADILFENSSLRNVYKEKYKDWLSNHPSGY